MAEVGHVVQLSSTDDSNVNMGSDGEDVMDEWAKRESIDKANQSQVLELRALLAEILPGGEVIMVKSLPLT